MPRTQLQVIRQSGDDVILVRKCPWCGKEIRRSMNAKDFDDGIFALQHGAHMQDAFPKADASTREMIMTGICDSCWDTLG